MTQWDLKLPWAKPPLSLNDREHWAPRAKKQKAVREASALLARQAGIPRLGTAKVRLVWLVSDRRRRDRENITATLKPAIDGLVDAGVVEDDCWWIVTESSCAIALVGKGEEGVYLQVLGEPEGVAVFL
nr:MAG TPA: Endodeoxyribonuclease RusA [Caudoviricetes sp.]